MLHVERTLNTRVFFIALSKDYAGRYAGLDECVGRLQRRLAVNCHRATGKGVCRQIAELVDRKSGLYPGFHRIFFSYQSYVFENGPLALEPGQA